MVSTTYLPCLVNVVCERPLKLQCQTHFLLHSLMDAQKTKLIEETLAQRYIVGILSTGLEPKLVFIKRQILKLIHLYTGGAAYVFTLYYHEYCLFFH